MELKKIFRMNKKGQSLVEMALIAPLLLLMFLGVVEVGWALRNFIVLQNGNREATRFAARGRYLDFSKTQPEEIGYPLVLQHELDSISGQVPLNVAGGANGTVIISHILVDTDECGGGADDDLILTPATPGYGHFTITYGQARPTQVNFLDLANQMRQENEVFNCSLATAAPSGEYIPSVNSAVIVETYFENYQLLGIPLIANQFTNPVLLYTRTIMRITADARGQQASAGQGCEVYPIAVHISTVDSVQPGDSLGDLFNGAGSGNFGWLRWNDDPGHTSAGYLNDELNNPRLSHNTYEEADPPGDDTDHNLNAGNWVWGLTGVTNSNDNRDTLDGLVNAGTVIRVPVWDTATGSGSNLAYHVQRFILVTLTAYDLPGVGGWIRATFVGEDPNACPDTPPVPSSPEEAATATSVAATATAGPAATATAAAEATATAAAATPTLTLTPVIPVGCDNPLPGGASTWTSLDIGGALTGYTSESGGAVYVCGSGSNIDGNSDGFRYAYRSVSGDNVDIIARVANWNGSSSGWSKAGLMIRNATSPNSANEAMVTTGSHGERAQYRLSDGGNTGSSSSGGGSGIPTWLRLVKAGATVRAYRSANGSTWTQVGADQTVNLGSTYLVGMAVTSNRADGFAYATFDSISVQTPGSTPTPTPTATATSDAQATATAAAQATADAQATATSVAATATAAAQPTTIASDNFDGGSSGWANNWTFSGDSGVVSTGTPHSGSNHLRVGSDDGRATRTVNMSGVTGAYLRFYWKANSFESGESAEVRINDGTWRTVLTVSNGQDDNNYHYADISLSGYTMTSTFRVRIYADMDSTNDHFYIDDIQIIGNR